MQLIWRHYECNYQFENIIIVKFILFITLTSISYAEYRQID